MFSNKQLKQTLIIGGLLISLLVVGSFVIYAQDDASTDEATVFNITMIDYEFVVEGQESGEPIVLEVGREYTLHFIHDGASEHEVLIGQEAHEIADGVHHDFSASLLEDVEVSIEGVMNDADFVIGVFGLEEFEMNPGQELSLTFTLGEDQIGDWELGCFIFLDEDASVENPSATHYDLGMHLVISVVAAE